MKQTLDLLREFGMSPADLAAALDRTVTELEQWMQGELRTEAADVIEVGVSLLASRLVAARERRDERTIACLAD